MNSAEAERRGDDAQPLWDRLASGDRRALARAISLCESTRADHRREAETLVARAAADARGEKVARIGITGPAGVGKSTLLDALGTLLLEQGRKPAVLAIDPSSRRTGGSLLGDQTRMVQLARGGAFVRPSPTRGHLGGVGAYTLEVALLCAAAGFDPVFVETVGVGQNETEVSDLVDCVILLLQPGAGDELQGMKRGLLEHADLVVVAQADGERRELAEETQRRFDGALRLLRGDAAPPVGLISTLEGRGVAELWQAVMAYSSRAQRRGEWDERRREQRVRWFRSQVLLELYRLLESRGAESDRFRELESAVLEGRTSIPDAVRSAIGLLERSGSIAR